MRCFPFANFHFQMGVTVMGFAEDSGQSLLLTRQCQGPDDQISRHWNAGNSNGHHGTSKFFSF